MPDLAPPLRNFTEDFFGPAIEAGTMTQKQAEFLTSGPFLMPLYSIIRDVRVGELTQEEVESGFLFVIKGDKFRLDGSLENGKILVAAGEAIGDAMVIQGSIAGVEERGRGCGSQGVRRVGTLIGSCEKSRNLSSEPPLLGRSPRFLTLQLPWSPVQSGCGETRSATQGFWGRPLVDVRRRA
jgi:hypothetical protein